MLESPKYHVLLELRTHFNPDTFYLVKSVQVGDFPLVYMTQ